MDAQTSKNIADKLVGKEVIVDIKLRLHKEIGNHTGKIETINPGDKFISF